MQVISAELRSSKHWELSGEGTEIAEQGSQEARVFSSVPPEGLPQSELMVSSQDFRLTLHYKYTASMQQVSCCTSFVDAAVLVLPVLELDF